MQPLYIAVPVWTAFAIVTVLYLYYAGRVTRRMREHHPEAWERLKRPRSWQGGKYGEPANARALNDIIWCRTAKLNDAELDRLANVTMGLGVLLVISVFASLLVLALFPDPGFHPR